MTRRIIQIEPTDSQWEVIDELFGLAAPFVAAVTDEHGAPTGELWVERIVDDSEVRLYTVQPDGSYVYEELSGGLHHGWTRNDEAGTRSRRTAMADAMAFGLTEVEQQCGVSEDAALRRNGRDLLIDCG